MPRKGTLPPIDRAWQGRPEADNPAMNAKSPVTAAVGAMELLEEASAMFSEPGRTDYNRANAMIQSAQTLALLDIARSLRGILDAADRRDR